MKAFFMTLALWLAPAALAAEHDLSDFCGTVRFVEQRVEVVVGEKIYRVHSGQHMSLEELRVLVEDGTSQCIRAWQDMNDPNSLVLYDVFAFGG